MVVHGRQDGAYGGTVDAGQGLQDKAGSRHQGAGITGANTTLRAAFLHQVDSYPHGRVFFSAQGLCRVFVHADHLGCMEYRKTFVFTGATSL